MRPPNGIVGPYALSSRLGYTLSGPVKSDVTSNIPSNIVSSTQFLRVKTEVLNKHEILENVFDTPLHDREENRNVYENFFI